jgi:hypothetical protein
MELILGLIGTITGVIALMATIVIQFRYERISAKQERRSEERERLLFLSNVIFDTSIPRESRQAFYDEYIAKKGNGPVIRFWLLEGEKEKKALEKNP